MEEAGTRPGPAALLLIGCSRRKRETPGLLPAIERYDGPVFRLLRRFQRRQPHGPRVLILSAAFGLIPAEQPIPWYDARMTRARATALQPEVAGALRARIGDSPPEEVVVCMGRTYRAALPDDATLPPRLPVREARGTVGAQLATLHDWLYGYAPPTPACQPAKNGDRGIRLRGIEIAQSADEALHIARDALAAGHGEPDAWQAWYVAVDERRVAPKWLVSQLTDLPVSAFSTDEARRVLAHLGIAVWRV